jgi:hypothetical protein
LNAVFTPVQERWQSDADLVVRLRGLHVVFYFPYGAPRGVNRNVATNEILEVLRSIDAEGVRPAYVMEPSPACPVLRSLDVTWSGNKKQADTRVQFRPSLTISDAGRVIDRSSGIVVNKKGKFSDYSDGGRYPVWLAAFVADGISGAGLTAIQEIAQNVKDLEILPFQRLMIANYGVAGLVVEANTAKPAIYQGLGEPELIPFIAR